MARRTGDAAPKCKACGHPMIMDETIIQGRAGRQIRRTFLHCINGQCGHIQRVGEYPIDPVAPEAPATR